MVVVSNGAGEALEWKRGGMVASMASETSVGDFLSEPLHCLRWIV